MKREVRKGFNKDKDTILFIYNNEIDLVKEMMDEYFSMSKTYDLKRKAKIIVYKPILDLACDIITIDIDAIEKLGGIEKAGECFKNGNIMDRYAIVKGISKEEMEKLFNNMPRKAHDVFVSLFGIGEEKMNSNELYELYDLNEDELYKLIKFNLKNLDRTIKDLKKDEEKIDEEIKEEAQESLVTENIEQKEENEVEKLKKIKLENIPTSFMDKYIALGYDPNDIRLVVGKYSRFTRNTLAKLYGSSFSSDLRKDVYITERDLFNLSIILNSKEKGMEALLKRYIVKVEFPVSSESLDSLNLFDYYRDIYEATKEDILASIYKLPPDAKEIVFKYFDEELNYKGKETMFESDYNSLIGILFASYSLMISNLKEIKRKQKDDNVALIDDVVKYYESLGYAKEDIMKSFKNCSETTYAILRKLYTPDLKLDDEYDSTDKVKKDITVRIVNPISQFVLSIMASKPKEIKNMPISDNISYDKRYNLFHYFGLLGIPAYIVEEAIKMLPKHYKTALETFWTHGYFIKENIYFYDVIKIKNESGELETISIDDVVNHLKYTIENIRDIKENTQREQIEKDVTTLIRKYDLPEEMRPFITYSYMDLSEENKNSIINFHKSTRGYFSSNNRVRVRCFVEAFVVAHIYKYGLDINSFLSYIGYDDGIINKTIYYVLNDLNSIMSNERCAEIYHILTKTITSSSLDELLKDQETRANLIDLFSTLINIAEMIKIGKTSMNDAMNAYYSILNDASVKKSIASLSLSAGAGSVGYFTNDISEKMIMRFATSDNILFKSLAEKKMYEALFKDVCKRHEKSCEEEEENKKKKVN